MAQVPYRNSVLTWLLKESLGGNSTTIMLATVSVSKLTIPKKRGAVLNSVVPLEALAQRFVRLRTLGKSLTLLTE